MFSGVVNGLFYAGSVYAFPIGLLFGAFTFWYLVRSHKNKWKDMKPWKRILSGIGIMTSVLSVWAVLKSFVQPSSIYSDVHLWTFANQTSVASTVFLHNKSFWGNLKGLILSVSPSAFFQKLMINIIPGNKWFYQGTDDVTGRTWGFKLFKFKVPRLGNMYIKLGLTILCILLFTIKLHKHSRPQEVVPNYTQILKYV